MRGCWPQDSLELEKCACGSLDAATQELRGASGGEDQSAGVSWATVGGRSTPTPAHHLWQDKVSATGLDALPSFTGIAHSPALSSFLGQVSHGLAHRPGSPIVRRLQQQGRDVHGAHKIQN